MRILGYRLVFRYGQPSAGEGLTVNIAPLPVIAFLKMSAYLDRLAERQHDLADIAHIVEVYGQDDGRRFDADVISTAGDYGLTTAILLGQDMGRFLDDEERAIVTQLLYI